MTLFTVSHRLSCTLLTLNYIIGVKTIEDCYVSQVNLNTVHYWCQSNSVHLNLKKCKRATSVRNWSRVVYDYSTDDNVSDRYLTIKDAGVQFDTILTINTISLKYM